MLLQYCNPALGRIVRNAVGDDGIRESIFLTSTLITMSKLKNEAQEALYRAIKKCVHASKVNSQVQAFLFESNETREAQTGYCKHPAFRIVEKLGALGHTRM